MPSAEALRIQFELKRRGYGATYIAALFGVHRSYVSHIIAGRRKHEAIEQFIRRAISVPARSDPADTSARVA